MAWTQWPPPTAMAPNMPGMSMATAPIPTAIMQPMAAAPCPAPAPVAATPGAYPPAAAAASLDQWTQMQQQNWQQWAQWQQQYQQWHQQYGEEYQKMAALQQQQQQPPLPAVPTPTQPPPPVAEPKPPLPPDDPPPQTSLPAKGYNTYATAPPPLPTAMAQGGYSTQAGYAGHAPPLPPPEEAKQPVVGPSYGYGYGTGARMQQPMGGYNTSGPPPMHQPIMQQPIMQQPPMHQPPPMAWNPLQQPPPQPQLQNKPPPNIQPQQQPQQQQQQQNKPPILQQPQQPQWGTINSDMQQGNQNQRGSWDNQQGRNSWGGNQNSGQQAGKAGRWSSGSGSADGIGGQKDGGFGTNQVGAAASQRGQQGGFGAVVNNQAAPPSLLSLNIQKPPFDESPNFGANNSQDFNQGVNINQEFSGNRSNNDFGSGNNNKRPYDQSQNQNAANFDAKRNKLDIPQQPQGWQNTDDNDNKSAVSANVEDNNKDDLDARIDAGKQQEIIDDMTEAERKFMKQFAEWEAQFNKWKEQNQDHPDKDQYKQYEKKWETWRNQLLDRREQMRKKRLAAQMKIQVHHIQAAPNSASTTQANPTTPAPQSKPSSISQPSLASPQQQQPVVPPKTTQQQQPAMSQQLQQVAPPPTTVPVVSNDFNRPPPFLNNEPLQFKGKPQAPQAIPGQTVLVEQPGLEAGFGSVDIAGVAASESEFLKTSTSAGGIPGLDLSDDGHKPTDVSKSADGSVKSGPDLEALSKNINNILGDAKLLSMLSMVSQNKNLASPEVAQPETVRTIEEQQDMKMQYDYNQKVMNQQMQWQPTVYQEEPQQQKHGFNAPPPNFGQPAPDFNNVDNSRSFGGGFKDKKENVDDNRGHFDDNRGNFSQNRGNFNDNSGGSFNFSDGPNLNNRPSNFNDRPPNLNDRPPNLNDRPPNLNDRPPNLNDRPPNFNDRPPNFNDRPPNFNDNRGGFNDARGSFNDNSDNFKIRPNFNDKPQNFNDNNLRGGNFKNTWNNQEQQQDNFSSNFKRGENVNRDDNIERRDSFIENSRDDSNANFGDESNMNMEDYTLDNYENDGFEKQPDIAQKVLPEPKPEPEPEPEPERELWSGKLFDYDHKPLKEPESDVMIEPLQIFDYRHRTVNRIPYPERPKWIAEILKNFHEFDLKTTRPSLFLTSGRGRNNSNINRLQFNENFDMQRDSNFDNRGFPSFREDRGRNNERGPGFDNRGRNNESGLDFDSRGQDFDNRGRHNERGPDFDNRGQDFDNRGRNNERSPDFDNRGQDFDKRDPNNEGGQNFDNRDHNFENRGPNFVDRGSKFENRGSNFGNRGGSKFGNRPPNRQNDRLNTGPDLKDSFLPINSPDSFSNEKDLEDDSMQETDKFNTSRQSRSNKPTECNLTKASDLSPNENTTEMEKDAPIFDIANPPPPKKDSNITMIKELLDVPGRFHRPPRIVIILRGPPGSGKTYLAKLIKDTEVEHGSSAPRILSLDDYFIVEQEKEVQEDGKTVKRKEMVYEYEEDMEESYRQSLLKAFKKTITDGYFPFIIVDNVNEKVKYFGEMWSFAKQNGFQVYVSTLDLDPVQCTRRNIHNRTAAQIERIVFGWEKTPAHHPVLDSSAYMTREDDDGGIADVEMEDVETSADADCISGELLDDMPNWTAPANPSSTAPFKATFKWTPQQVKTTTSYNQNTFRGARRGFGGRTWRNGGNRRR